MAPEILADEGLDENENEAEDIWAEKTGEGLGIDELVFDSKSAGSLSSRQGNNPDTHVVAKTTTDTRRGALRLTFEGMKAADVYAFGLVLWEIFRRSLTRNGKSFNIRFFLKVTP